LKLKMFGRPKPARPVDVINSALRTHVSVGRFRISHEQGLEIKRIEANHGKEAGLQRLLQILATKD
jgi:hypothetical protein